MSNGGHGFGRLLLTMELLTGFNKMSCPMPYKHAELADDGHVTKTDAK